VPTYDYQCRSCGDVVEVVHSMLEDGPTTCERCGGQLRRVMHPAGIIFKGSGFYRNDSRSSDPTSPASGSRASSPAAEGSTTSDSGDGAPAAPKSDATPKTPSSSGSGAGD
jgi:putative FmdB family regulatory protein